MKTRFKALGFTVCDSCTTFEELDTISLMLKNRLPFLFDAAEKRLVKADIARLDRLRRRVELRASSLPEY